ncbi:hypothetical protein N657DRAFT_633852 [Parathielavia appendiculata]|uniref:Uncharacterized protein n=1 Tax=Parathielavia appendiculata TaxID=2587402 RepID=A0AAN6Z375_9PEZI|nr:hypothetical protein N657DRAFT_633852 [Parathielavia appendiculata]
METPTERNARQHVEKIRRDTLGGVMPAHVPRCCLRVGSKFDDTIRLIRLYAKSTHFLLEIIQNADDNNYNCPTPTLRFSYRPGSLRIDCNEAGFTEEKVEAICAINRSTKSGKTSYGEHIGEKGIGFKSVFRVADVVWISSGAFRFKLDKTSAFRFKLDKTKRLGILQLTRGAEGEVLMHELLSFDVNLLIFLRRIQEISICVVGQDDEARE